MTDDDVRKRLRESIFLAFEDGTKSFVIAPEAAEIIEALTAELDEAREDYGRESDQHDATAANLLAVEAERDKYKLIATHSEDVVRAAKVEIERLREALEPFAEFARVSGFDKLPLDTPMTQGSRLARKQVTVADFIRARAALKGDSRE